MGHTIVEKILAAHAGIADCKPGDFLVADIDFAMLTDARAPGAMKAMGQIPEAPLRVGWFRRLGRAHRQFLSMCRVMECAGRARRQTDDDGALDHDGREHAKSPAVSTQSGVAAALCHRTPKALRAAPRLSGSLSSFDSERALRLRPWSS